jgi:hypothetical protein
MTLLAAYRPLGIPVLVGDALTTSFISRGLKKKIYYVSPNLVIGWTGFVKSAKVLIPKIFDRFFAKAVLKEDLEGFFVNSHFDFEDQEGSELRIIGWLINREGPHCFLWQSLWPREVFYSDFYFEGSGQKYFSSMLVGENVKASGGSKIDEPQAPPTEALAIIDTLTHCGQAFFDEVIAADRWDRSFGFAYELFSYFHDGFRTPGSTLYLGWDYHWDAIAKKGRALLSPFAAKMNFHGHYSILQKVEHNKLEIKRTTNFAIRPVYPVDIDSAHGSAAFEFASNFYVHFLIKRTGPPEPRWLTFVTGDGEPRQPIQFEIDNGKPRFDVDHEYLDDIFRRAGA